MRTSDVAKRLLEARRNGNGAIPKTAPSGDETPRSDGPTRGFAVVATDDTPEIAWEPVPVEALPVGLGELVRHGAKALGVDAALLTLPALAVLATCIGTTRALMLQRSWVAYAILWAATVIRSGGRKSPAQALVLDPLHGLQREKLREHDIALERYEAEQLEYKAALLDWQKNKDRGEPPSKPFEPNPIRYLTADTTIEALAWLLSTNPRGIGAFNDELAAFLKSFDCYKSKGGGDAARWLELYRAGTLVVDRKHGNPRTIYVPRAAVSVAGTVQPGTLQRLLTPEYFEMGLAARFIFAAPPEKPRQYIEADIPQHVTERYTELLRRLLALDHVSDGQGELAPKIVRLSESAKGAWVAWCNEIGARIDGTLDDDERAFLSKAEELPARLALIVHCAQAVTSPDYSEDILQADSIERGITLARWATQATLAVYGALREPENTREGRKLLSWIGTRGGKCTTRDVTRGLRRFRGDIEGAKQALDGLVNQGLGQWTYPSGPGRSTAVFEITQLGDGDETPIAVSENGGCGTEPDGNGAVGSTGCGLVPPDE